MKASVWRSLCALIFISYLMSFPAYADEGKISGYFLGDYYYVVKSHIAELEDRNGFQFRRVYFTYDKGLSEAFKARFRLEMNSPSFPDKEKNVKLNPFIKHGYLKWTKEDWRTHVYFGLSGTPTWEVIEALWGYRSVAETLLDMQKLGGSTDFAVAVFGNFDAGKKLSFHAMVGNGSGVSGEIDSDKKFYLSLTARPIKGVVAEGYGDFETSETDQERYTVQGFLAYEREQFRIGAQLANQTRKQGEDKANLNLMAGSVFGAAQLIEKKLWALARFDRMFDPNPDAEKIAYAPYDKTAKSNTLIFGIDWTPIKDVHLIPNLFLIFYDEPEKSEKPDAAIVPRLTVYYTY